MSVAVYVLNCRWLPDAEDAIGKQVQSSSEDGACPGWGVGGGGDGGGVRVISRQDGRAAVVQAGGAADGGWPGVASRGRQWGGAHEGKSTRGGTGQGELGRPRQEGRPFLQGSSQLRLTFQGMWYYKDPPKNIHGPEIVEALGEAGCVWGKVKSGEGQRLNVWAETGGTQLMLLLESTVLLYF